MTKMEWSKAKILVVDDSKTVRVITSKALTERGYEVKCVATGEEALLSLDKELPDLIVLDVELPDVDGFEICRKIRSDPRMHSVPVLVLTVLDQPGFEVIAIDAGADDFVTKPVDPLVLDARIGMIVRRARRERHANPLTGLPGGLLVEQEVAVRLNAGRAFAVCAVDLDGFKFYNDRYGYEMGDQVILLTASLVEAAAVAGKDDFVGHPGGDDFVFITNPKRCAEVAKKIIASFDEAISAYYDSKTRQRGYFEVTSRQGAAKKVPMMTISLAMVSNEKQEFASSIEMFDALGELKRYTKTFAESIYVVERRSPDNPRLEEAHKSLSAPDSVADDESAQEADPGPGPDEE